MVWAPDWDASWAPPRCIPLGRGPGAGSGHAGDDYVPQLALGTLPEELEEVAEERDIRASLPPQLPEKVAGKSTDRRRDYTRKLKCIKLFVLLN